MLFNFHFSHYCALNHCFNYLINIMFYQSQLKETEAEDNMLFFISNKSKSAFLITVKSRLTNLDITKSSV